jgi:hypothetical protein
MTRKYWAWPLILTLAGSLRAAVSVSIPNTSVPRGATVEIPLQTSGYTIAGSDSLVAYQAAVLFDPTALQAVGATGSGTMTANWGGPTIGVKPDKRTSGIKRDTLFVVGITTNQPSKRTVQDSNILVKLQFLVTDTVGQTNTLVLHDVRMFNLQGAMTMGTKTNGVLTVTAGSSPKTVNLPLVPGINFVSFPVTPANDALPGVLGSVPVNFIWGYYSGYPKSWQLGRPINPLASLDGLHGYWMRLNSATNATLTLTGPEIAVTTPIQMIKGLNLIGYLPASQDTITHAYASIDTFYSYVWTYVAATGSPRSWQRRRVINPLSKLSSLLAYWVRMSNFGTLVFPSSGYVPKAAAVRPGQPAAVSDDSPPAVTTEWCDFWGQQPGTLQTGDTIRVYDQSGVFCGDTLVVDGGIFLVAVAGDDPMTPELDEGASPGEEVRFTVNGRQASITGTSACYETEIIPGAKPFWTPQGSYRVELASDTSGIRDPRGEYPAAGQIRLVRNYPNPFNSRTEFTYELSVRADVRLEVFDAMGRGVRTVSSGSQTPGLHTLSWDGEDDRNRPVSSGVYFYALKAGRDVRTGKCLLLK